MNTKYVALYDFQRQATVVWANYERVAQVPDNETEVLKNIAMHRGYELLNGGFSLAGRDLPQFVSDLSSRFPMSES